MPDQLSKIQKTALIVISFIMLLCFVFGLIINVSLLYLIASGFFFGIGIAFISRWFRLRNQQF